MNKAHALVYGVVYAHPESTSRQVRVWLGFPRMASAIANVQAVLSDLVETGDLVRNADNTYTATH